MRFLGPPLRMFLLFQLKHLVFFFFFYEKEEDGNTLACALNYCANLLCLGCFSFAAVLVVFVSTDGPISSE